MGKVLFETKGEIFVDIDRQFGRKAGEMGTETETADPREKVDNIGFSLFQDAVLPVVLSILGTNIT